MLILIVPQKGEPLYAQFFVNTYCLTFYILPTNFQRTGISTVKLPTKRVPSLSPNKPAFQIYTSTISYILFLNYTPCVSGKPVYMSSIRRLSSTPCAPPALARLNSSRAWAMSPSNMAITPLAWRACGESPTLDR